MLPEVYITQKPSHIISYIPVNPCAFCTLTNEACCVKLIFPQGCSHVGSYHMLPKTKMYDSHLEQRSRPFANPV